MTTASYPRYFPLKLSFFNPFHNELTKKDRDPTVVGLESRGEAMNKCITDFDRVIVF